MNSAKKQKGTVEAGGGPGLGFAPPPQKQKLDRKLSKQARKTLAGCGVEIATRVPDDQDPTPTSCKGEWGACGRRAADLGGGRVWFPTPVRFPKFSRAYPCRPALSRSRVAARSGSDRVLARRNGEARKTIGWPRLAGRAPKRSTIALPEEVPGFAIAIGDWMPSPAGKDAGGGEGLLGLRAEGEGALGRLEEWNTEKRHSLSGCKRHTPHGSCTHSAMFFDKKRDDEKRRLRLLEERVEAARSEPAHAALAASLHELLGRTIGGTTSSGARMGGDIAGGVRQTARGTGRVGVREE